MNRHSIGTPLLAAWALSVSLVLSGCATTAPGKRAEPTPAAGSAPTAAAVSVASDAHAISTWTFVDGGNGLNKDLGQDTYIPQLTAFNGKLYAAWREMTDDPMQIHVTVYNSDDSAPAWKFVDGKGNVGINHNPAKHAFDIQLTVFNGKMYAIWQEGSDTVDQIRVAVYNGDDAAPAWTFIDGNTATGINHDAGRGAGYPQLTVFNGKLYATWSEMNDVSEQIRVAMYSGDDTAPAWRFIDGNGLDGLNKYPAADAYYPQLTAFGSRLYAAWEETSPDRIQIRVAVFNGDDAQPAWRFVDSDGVAGLNHDSAREGTYVQLTEFRSRLYATWTEINDTGKQVRVAVYNGNDTAPAWSFVDGNGVNGINHNAGEYTYTPQLTVFGDQLYATWYENHDTDTQIRIARYNGNDAAPAWSFADGGANVGINRNPRHSGFDPQLTVFADKLYATWKESNGTERGHQIRVAVGK